MNGTVREKVIDPLSAVGLFLELSVNNNRLSSATGFIVEKNNRKYLITNWHVVSGKDPKTEKPISKTAGLPDTIRIAHHIKNKLGSWKFFDEPLYKNDQPLWIEHPNSKKNLRVDVVALPITRFDEETIFYPLNLNLANTDMVAQPAMPTSIIGFPLGLASAGAFPIWKTGHIASDPDLNYNNQPSFLIDATTREGMSGSPVVLRLTGGYRQRNGNWIISTGAATLFLGVYSGRIHSNSEIGVVWKPEIIEAILNLF